LREPAPLPFLARPGYRRRRLIEAIRLLPYAGAILFFFPLLWPASESTERSTAGAAIYLFSAWLVLIVAAFAGARALDRAEASDDADDAPR